MIITYIARVGEKRYNGSYPPLDKNRKKLMINNNRTIFVTYPINSCIGSIDDKLIGFEEKLAKKKSCIWMPIGTHKKNGEIYECIEVPDRDFAFFVVFSGDIDFFYNYSDKQIETISKFIQKIKVSIYKSVRNVFRFY